MGFVIRNRENGMYVTPPGHPTAYTPLVTHAKVFETLEAASKEIVTETEEVVRIGSP